MAKQEVPLTTLSDYLPDCSAEKVMKMLNEYAVHLTITKQRQSILGDYRPAHDGKPHRISVNGNLNPYAFLITLLHELAHLLTFTQYRNRVQPHGKEWKQLFGLLLQNFTSDKIFPDDIEAALKKSIHNPGASSCSDLQLMRTLRKYDAAKVGHYTVEQLETGTHFKIKDGREFVKGEKNRTRYKCQLLGTKQFYLFHGMYEVMVDDTSNEK